MTYTVYCHISLRNVSARLNLDKNKKCFSVPAQTQAVECAGHGFLFLCHNHLYKDNNGRFPLTKSLLESCKD